MSDRLLTTLHVYQVLFAASTVLLVGVGGYHAWYRHETDAIPQAVPHVQPDAPHSRDVRRILRALRYSGVPVFLHPDVSLSLDPERRTWTLHNVHQFDAQGNIVLRQGRYGICGDLAAYTYQQIRPIFEERYRIEFVQAAEASYFKHELGGSHSILRIIDTEAGTDGETYTSVYVLDPGLRRYGSPEIFDDYMVATASTTLDFLAERSPDEMYAVGKGPPIFLSRTVQVSLFMLEERGRFDLDNFRLVLAATPRFHYVRRAIFEIRKSQGVIEASELESRYAARIPRAVRTAMMARLTEMAGRMVLSPPAGEDAASGPGTNSQLPRPP